MGRKKIAKKIGETALAEQNCFKNENPPGKLENACVKARFRFSPADFFVKFPKKNVPNGKSIFTVFQ